jgi:sulfate/thiosulfate transport system permease protein
VSAGGFDALQRAALRRRSEGESPWARRLVIGLALGFVAVFLVAPVLTVFISAFAKGIGPYWDALVEPDTLSALRLTLLVAAVVVPFNAAFGIAAAWLFAMFEFRWKSALLTLVDLPFSVSPVIAGLVFILLFGAQGLFGKTLAAHDIRIIFALPGIFLASAFVTFPIVAREVQTVMQAQGNDEEEAALTLGATGWQILFRVTLPKLRWGLIYGVILCNARAMGEFGAVSVVSGHVRGETNTLPLHVEILYNEYHFVAAFGVASLLALLAFVTLGVKKLVEQRNAQQDAQALADAPLLAAGGAATAPALRSGSTSA